jgi:hypothetical protein
MELKYEEIETAGLASNEPLVSRVGQLLNPRSNNIGGRGILQAINELYVEVLTDDVTTIANTRQAKLQMRALISCPQLTYLHLVFTHVTRRRYEEMHRISYYNSFVIQSEFTAPYNLSHLTQISHHNYCRPSTPLIFSITSRINI